MEKNSQKYHFERKNYIIYGVFVKIPVSIVEQLNTCAYYFSNNSCAHIGPFSDKALE